jgi:Ni,Fe-hydrogenase I cytochrome b subunit
MCSITVFENQISFASFSESNKNYYKNIRSLCVYYGQTQFIHVLRGFMLQWRVYFFFLERKEKLTIIDIAICMSFLEIMPRIQFIVDRKGHVWLKHNPIHVSFLFFLIFFIIYLVINVKNHRS